MTDPYGPPDPVRPPPPPGPQWQPVPPAWQQLPGWPAQPWYGAPAPTNGYAIASLATSLTVPLPIGLGLGLVALRQIRRTGEAGRGMAIAGIVISSVWLVLLVVFVVAIAVTEGGEYSREGDLDDIASTAVGTCLTLDPSTVTDCSAPHEREVYYATAVPRSSWPGEGEVDSIADDICFEAFDDYVGSSWHDSTYGYAYYAPSFPEWNSGSRELVCVITPAGEYLVGSVRDSVA